MAAIDPETNYIQDIRKPQQYRLHNTRLGLRIVALISEIVAFSTLVPLYVCTHTSKRDHYGFVIVLIAMLWNALEILTQCFNKRGMHPGILALVDFLLCLAMCLIVGLKELWIRSIEDSYYDEEQRSLPRLTEGLTIISGIFTVLAM
jgi:hypothetical protein